MGELDMARKAAAPRRHRRLEATLLQVDSADTADAANVAGVS